MICSSVVAEQQDPMKMMQQMNPIMMFAQPMFSAFSSMMKGMDQQNKKALGDDEGEKSAPDDEGKKVAPDDDDDDDRR